MKVIKEAELTIAAAQYQLEQVIRAEVAEMESRSKQVDELNERRQVAQRSGAGCGENYEDREGRCCRCA